MDHDPIFSIAGMSALIGWIALVLLPLIPVRADRDAGLLVPSVLPTGSGSCAI
jgi:hypothetical protein